MRREKQMKKWNRGWKLELIEKQNPDWRDLWEGMLCGGYLRKVQCESLDSRLRGNDELYPLTLEKTLNHKTSQTKQTK